MKRQQRSDGPFCSVVPLERPKKFPPILSRAAKFPEDSMRSSRQLLLPPFYSFQLILPMFYTPEPKITKNSCPVTRMSSKPNEILVSKTFQGVRVKFNA